MVSQTLVPHSAVTHSLMGDENGVVTATTTTTTATHQKRFSLTLHSRMHYSTMYVVQYIVIYQVDSEKLYACSYCVLLRPLLQVRHTSHIYWLCQFACTVYKAGNSFLVSVNHLCTSKAYLRSANITVRTYRTVRMQVALNLICYCVVCTRYVHVPYKPPFSSVSS